MNKLYGYREKLLRVDLTNEKITEEKIDEETARKYVGGTGIGAKYLYEEVPAGVEWSDESNRIIIASGPLGGSNVGGTGTVSVVTKGPLTNGAVASQANGFFGAFLRFAGYDGIIIQGRAKKWVYLYIHDDGAVELKDASHLMGKDNWETNDLLKAEYGKREREMSVASVGVAGENLVRFACIFFDKGHTASHNGTAAVMGSKKLKAIAIARGKGRPTYKDRKALTATSKQAHDSIRQAGGIGLYQWGTLNILSEGVISGRGVVPVKNYTTNVFDIDREKLEKFWGPYLRREFKAKPDPCYGCRLHHCHMMTIPDGKYKGHVGEEPEYEGFAAFGPVIGNDDSSAAFYLANEADRLGIDCNEAGWTIGMAIECYEKGIITREDTDGLELTWGNYEAALEMMHRIATRQGFGDVLAEGAMRAAQQIGGEAPNFAIHTMKGNTPRVHDHRTRWPMLFDTCLSQMSTDEGYSVADPADIGLSISAQPSNLTSPEDTVVWNVQFKGGMQFLDCVGVCSFTIRTNLKLLAQGVSAATGWDFSPQEAMEVGRRIVNLLRVFNIKHGHTAEMDAPSPRYGSVPEDGPAQGKDVMVHWNDMRSKYYEGMGWDKETGKPLPDTLRHLGLEHTIPDLW